VSVFLERNHLFARTPGGDIEHTLEMKAAQFGILLANVGDNTPEEWEPLRILCERDGLLLCPWLRTADANGVWQESKLDYLIDVADDWGTPVVDNSESELDDSGAELTSLIASKIGKRDGAVSVLAWPMDSVDWEPICHLPILPQLFNAESGSAARDPGGCIWQWHHRGARCVLPTFGAYGGQGPDDSLPRLSPYGVYTANDMNQQFAAWAPQGAQNPCKGEEMTLIGSQHGVTAAVNRLRDSDPAGTLLKKQGNKWPPLSSLTQPLDQWKAYDKLERTLSILVTDHDAGE